MGDEQPQGAQIADNNFSKHVSLLKFKDKHQEQ